MTDPQQSETDRDSNRRPSTRGLYGTLQLRGRAASDFYAGREDYFSLTPAGLTLLHELKPLLREHCRGRVLDAGAGRGAYRDLLLNHADVYVGMDVGMNRGLAVLGDAQRLPFGDDAFDTVFCSQVLEHVPEPWLALAEFRRVLKPEGKLILSVPHISWLHNEPHDYYRYTNHGLVFLLHRAGFRCELLVPAGGLLSLLGHILSTVLINITFGTSWLHRLSMAGNRGFVRLVAFCDRRIEKKKIFALNYVVVAGKNCEDRCER